jgi:hypothetical protein
MVSCLINEVVGMGSFSLMHWIVVLAIILILFSAGGLRRASFPQSASFSIVMFSAGAVTSAIAVVISLSLGSRNLAMALDYLSQHLDVYLIVFASSGMTWILFGMVLRQFGSPSGLISWTVRVAPVAVLAVPIAALLSLGLRALLLGADVPSSVYQSRYWFGFLDTPPYNITALIRSGILVAIAGGIGGFGLDSDRVRSQVWSPGTGSGSGPGQTTRLLCGNALLGGSAFRRRVLNFFENKRTAVAPEDGVDVWLLANVCAFAEARGKAYAFGFAGIGILGVLFAAGSAAWGVTLLVLAGGTLWFVKWRGEQRLARGFFRETFSPEGAFAQFGGKLEREITYAFPSEGQNLIVYKGFMPFVGAGLDLNGWSFVASVDKPKIACSPIQHFNTAELDAALNLGLSKLEIPHLECRKVYFVRGIDIRDNAEILGDLGNRPRQEIELPLQAHYDAQQDERVRSYKRIQITDWGGELILTFFLRCVLRGPSLFVELRRFLLPPIANEYRRVDRMLVDRLGVRIGQFLGSLAIGPVYAVFAPLIAFVIVQEVISRAFTSDRQRVRQHRREVQNDPLYDFGADASLRASFAQTSFMHYYQKTDADFESKVVEKKILDEIERFLDAHGIDTSDIRERQTTILNSGILVQGGDVRAESLAVGQGAMASKVEGAGHLSRKESRNE